jgi:transglutaminase-like putative cysteine protease
MSPEEFPARYIYVAKYEYGGPTVQNDNSLRLVPYPDKHCIVERYHVVTSPTAPQVEFRDHFENIVHRFRITEPHRELFITVTGDVRLRPWQEDVYDVPMNQLKYDSSSQEFLDPSPLIDPARLANVAHDLSGDSPSLISTVLRVVNWVYTNIEYTRGLTTVNTRAEDVLALRKGVCQDKTHLAIGILRAMGIPCRYVSAILTHQVGETHALLEFLHPVAGWVPADPTRNMVIHAGIDYIKLAVGRDYTDAPPVTGGFTSQWTGRLVRVLCFVRFNADEELLEEATSIMNLKEPWGK